MYLSILFKIRTTYCKVIPTKLQFHSTGGKTLTWVNPAEAGIKVIKTKKSLDSGIQVLSATTSLDAGSRPA